MRSIRQHSNLNATARTSVVMPSQSSLSPPPPPPLPQLTADTNEGDNDVIYPATTRHSTAAISIPIPQNSTKSSKRPPLNPNQYFKQQQHFQSSQQQLYVPQTVSNRLAYQPAAVVGVGTISHSSNSSVSEDHYDGFQSADQTESTTFDRYSNDAFKQQAQQQHSHTFDFKFSNAHSIQQDYHFDDTNTLQNSSSLMMPNRKHFLEDLPPQPIIDRPYSLVPDMMFGWVPKIQFNGAIPLRFQNNVVDTIIKELSKPNSVHYAHHKICYIGFRPATTVDIHEKYAANSDNKSNTNSSESNGYHYKYDSKFLRQVMPQAPVTADSRPIEGNNPMYAARKDVLKFDSTFESGNLDLAVKVGQQVDGNSTDEYDLFMRVDSNTRGHFQWYYFIVSNTRKHSTVKFNICNFYKKKSLYSRVRKRQEFIYLFLFFKGMKPYVFSQKEQEKKKTKGDSEQVQQENSDINIEEQFEQSGMNVTYKQQKYRYSFLYGSGDNDDYDDEDSEEETTGVAGRKQPYCLSFEYEFQHNDDRVSFAFCVPYTYTRLQKFIRRCVTLYSKDYLTEEKLCQTLSGVNVPLLTVTDKHDTSVEVQRKQVVLISARIHPGESNGSWMMQGLLLYLLGSSAEAIALRRSSIFKIIPMLNPDGVIVGNYRSGLAGRDLNRVFQSKDKVLYPTVIAMKELVNELKLTYAKRLSTFIDLHGHSVKKNAFVYGPEFPIYDVNYFQCRALPKLISDATDMFRFHSSIFKISKGKRNTGRAVLFRQFNIPMSFTLEASNGTYAAGVPFNAKKYVEVGTVVAKSIQVYMSTLMAYEERQISKKKLKANQSVHVQQSSRANSNNREVEQNDEEQQADEDTTTGTTIGGQSRTRKAIKRIQESKKRRKSKSSKSRVSEEMSSTAAVIEQSPFMDLFKGNGDDLTVPMAERLANNNSNGINGHESDEFSEGGSDSESSDDDYDKRDLERMRDGIVSTQKAIREMQNGGGQMNSSRLPLSSKRPSTSTHAAKKINEMKSAAMCSDSNITRSRKNSASLEQQYHSTTLNANAFRLTSAQQEKRGIYVSKTIRPSTTATVATSAKVIKQPTSSSSYGNAAGGEVNESNVNREVALLNRRRHSGQISSNKVKSESYSAKQPSYLVPTSSNFIPQVKPLKGGASLSKKELPKSLNQGNHSNYIVSTVDEQSQLFVPRKTSRLQQELQNAVRNAGRQEEVVQYQLTLNTPKSTIGLDIPDYAAIQNSRRMFEAFRQKNTCPSAFYAIKKHFAFKKKDDFSVAAPLPPQPPPPLPSTYAHQPIQSLSVPSVQFDQNRTSTAPLLANATRVVNKNKSFSYQQQQQQQQLYQQQQQYQMSTTSSFPFSQRQPDY